MIKKSKFVFLGVFLLAVGGLSVSTAEGAGFLPSMYDLQHNVRHFLTGPDTVKSRDRKGGCEQSATSSDCIKVAEQQPLSTVQSDDASQVVAYSETNATNQVGKIDAHLAVDNALKKVQFCNKSYKSRQISVDGVDIVQKIADLATSGAMLNDSQGNAIATGICNSMPGNMTYIRGVLEISDVTTYTSDDPKLPGNTYRIYLAAQGFDVNPGTGKIYLVGGYDGTLTDIGALK